MPYLVRSAFTCRHGNRPIIRNIFSACLQSLFSLALCFLHSRGSFSYHTHTPRLTHMHAGSMQTWQHDFIMLWIEKCTGKVFQWRMYLFWCGGVLSVSYVLFFIIIFFNASVHKIGKRHDKMRWRESKESGDAGNSGSAYLGSRSAHNDGDGWKAVVWRLVYYLSVCVFDFG